MGSGQKDVLAGMFASPTPQGLVTSVAGSLLQVASFLQIQGNVQERDRKFLTKCLDSLELLLGFGPKTMVNAQSAQFKPKIFS
jgi:hypothetical protein